MIDLRLDLVPLTIFERGDIDADIHAHLRKSAGDWKDEADAIITELGLPTICGEWSLGLDLLIIARTIKLVFVDDNAW